MGSVLFCSLAPRDGGPVVLRPVRATLYYTAISVMLLPGVSPLLWALQGPYSGLHLRFLTYIFVQKVIGQGHHTFLIWNQVQQICLKCHVWPCISRFWNWAFPVHLHLSVPSFLVLIERAAHTQHDSPGGSIRL